MTHSGYFKPINKTFGDFILPDRKSTQNVSCPSASVEANFFLTQLIVTSLIGPFTFFNVQKTKYLQILTSLMRWIGKRNLVCFLHRLFSRADFRFGVAAFISMISYAVYRLATVGPQNTPKMASLTGMPALVGASIYSFMCHHSLPSLITPITDKRYLTR